MVQLGYFTLDTLDIEKARAFYGALFGWRFDEAASGPTYAHVADSEPAFGFTKVERTRDFAHLYFRVDDVDALCKRVTELGGKARSLRQRLRPALWCQTIRASASACGVPPPGSDAGFASGPPKAALSGAP